MKETRVIIYGMGTIGREVVQCLDTKEGMRIVGAIDLQHVGEDIGPLSGLDKELGVKITDDADKLFDEVEADVLFHLITTTVDDCAKQLKKPIAKKMQIITSAEEMVNPYYYNKEQSAAIDKMAKDAGVSVLGSGLWPTYMDVYIPLALTGGVREIKRLEYRRKADFKPYADSLVVPKFGLRQTKEEFEKNLEEGNVVGHTGFEGTFLTFCDMFGWKLEDVKTEFVPYYGDDGKVYSVKHTATGIVDGEERLYNEIWASLEDDWEPSDYYKIDGKPAFEVEIPGGIVGILPVANCLVNQMPMVMNAKPGLLTRPSMGMFAFGNLTDHLE